MEQQKKNIAPLPVAADPVYIPGLTAPAPAKPVEEEAEDDVEVAGVDEADADADAEPGAVREDEDASPDDGASFSVSDRRGSITADRTGVRYTLDDQEADFHWDEIVAVEIGHSRFGRRFMVTVHTEGSRWYPSEIVAPDKASLVKWEEELDVVLDAYFEEE